MLNSAITKGKERTKQFEKQINKTLYFVCINQNVPKGYLRMKIWKFLFNLYSIIQISELATNIFKSGALINQKKEKGTPNLFDFSGKTEICRGGAVPIPEVPALCSDGACALGHLPGSQHEAQLASRTCLALLGI